MPQLKSEVQDELPISWKKAPILYVYILQYLIGKSFDKTSRILTKRGIIEIWHRHIYHLPKVYDFYIIKELEQYGLIEKAGNNQYTLDINSAKYVVLRLKTGSCMKNNDPPYLYLHVFRRMVTDFGRRNIFLSSNQIMQFWRKHIPNVARVYDNVILQEMCAFGLLRQINSQKYIFLGAASFCKLKKLTNGYTTLW